LGLLRPLLTQAALTAEAGMWQARSDGILHSLTGFWGRRARAYVVFHLTNVQMPLHHRVPRHLRPNDWPQVVHQAAGSAGSGGGVPGCEGHTTRAAVASQHPTGTTTITRMPTGTHLPRATPRSGLSGCWHPIEMSAQQAARPAGDAVEPRAGLPAHRSRGGVDTEVKHRTCRRRPPSSPARRAGHGRG
jgi:hypothetical protein